MSTQRKAVRSQKKDLQEQITQLVSMAYEANMALGSAVDVLSQRVKALEDALERARGNAAKSNGHGIITLKP